MYYDNHLRVHRAAERHGIDPGDALVASSRFLVSFTIDEEGERELRLGFDSRARLLETVVLHLDDGGGLIIHAMKARLSYLALLPEGWDG